MILNKKELAAVAILTGSGILGWGIDLVRGDRGRAPAEGLRVEADTNFCRPTAPDSISAVPVMAPVDSVKELQGLVYLNTASAAELEGLPGIGPALSRRIIEYRTAKGLFKTKEELMQVKGVGKKKYEKIKGRLLLTPDH